MELLIVISLKSTKKNALDAALSCVENADSESLVHRVLLHGAESLLLTFEWPNQEGSSQLHDSMMEPGDMSDSISSVFTGVCSDITSRIMTSEGDRRRSV